MGQINTQIDAQILKNFRAVIFTRYGLRRGDFKKALEEAMNDYVKKYGNSTDSSNLYNSLKTSIE